MIYAVIIIIALAVAFAILVRRLPKAMEESAETFHDLPRATATRPAIRMPSVDFSSIHLPKIGAKMSRPAQPSSRTEEAGSQTASPVASAKPAFTMPKLPAFKLPSFHLPKRPSRPVNTPAEPITEQPQPSKSGRNRDDFWQGSPAPTNLEQPKTVPTPAPAEPVTAPPAPKPTPAPSFSMPNLNPKGRARNLEQEAEDAFAIKDFKKSERLYLRLATEDPKNPKVYSRLGVIYLEQKSYEDARDALQAAIKLEPNVATRHFNLALTYLQLGSKAKAISSMESALKYDPSNRKYRKMLDDIIAGRA